MNQIDREIEQLERDYEEGLISQKEFYRQVRDIEGDVRAFAEQEAERAYQDTMDNYGYHR